MMLLPKKISGSKKNSDYFFVLLYSQLLIHVYLHFKTVLSIFKPKQIVF